MRMRGAAMALVLAALAGEALAATREEWTRAKINDDLQRFVAWAERDGLSAIPSSAGVTLDPTQLALFLPRVPLDPHSQLALGVLLLQGGHPRAAVAPLSIAARDPALAGRARALLGCTLVMLGRYRDAIPQLDAAPLEASCRWQPEYTWLGPVATWRAAARCGLGDGAGARQVSAAALGSRAALVDPSVPSEMDERDAAVSMACIVGDSFEFDGDLASAETLWRRGHCVDRLDELEAGVDPFSVLVRHWDNTGWLRIDTPSAVASTALGDVAAADGELESGSHRCALPVAWTPNCIRLPHVRHRLAPALAAQRRAIVPTHPISPPHALAERPVPEDLGTPVDSSLDRRPIDAALVPGALVEWHVIRVERDGKQVVALSFGRRTERSVHDALLTYRIHVSHDGGERFDAPLCFGVPDRYIVRARSRIPMLSGKTVRVEALRGTRNREGSEQGGEWPWGGDPVAVLLTSRLAELARDGDGDGLTDIQERWWSLDPRRADSDGDTVDDAQDPNPRLPPSSRRPELDALIEWLVSDEAVAAPEIEGESSTPPSRARAAALPLLQEDLLLVQIRPVPFFHQAWMEGVAAVPPSSEAGPRVITLSEAEARPLIDEFTGHDGLIRLKIVLDLDGSRALVHVDRGSEGGEYLAERGASGWRLRGLTSWVN